LNAPQPRWGAFSTFGHEVPLSECPCFW